MLTIYFTFIRNATYNYLDTLISTYPEIYARRANFCITSAMGIDGNYNIFIDNLENAILKAKKTDSYLVLYAHVINESNDDYSVTPQYLEDLFKIMKKHRVGATTCREII